MHRSTVAIIPCENYDSKLLHDALSRGLEMIGGVKQFVSPGERILLKPNCLWPSPPERCVTTHPALFKEVALILQSADVKVSYGDSPGGISSAESVFKKTEFHTIARELGLTLEDFNHGINTSFRDGQKSKVLHLVKALQSVDGVISLPKFKTHGLTRFTGAIKNQYGCVPGTIKGEYHARFPDIEEFSELVVEICAAVKPRLYIMDAIMAMEGNGPGSGDPKKLGYILLSSDPVALDTVCCKMIDLDPSFVPTCRHGATLGLGTNNLEEIKIVGKPLQECIDKSFKATRRPPIQVPKSKLMQNIKRAFTPRPVISKSLCIKCGKCIESCPVKPKAIYWRLTQKKKPPVYDYTKCIRCFCCHELCPVKAITIKKPLLLKLIPLASYISLLRLNLIHKRQKRLERKHSVAK